jgi:phosphoglycolate phosphatase
VIYVGDSMVDQMAAKAAGIPFVAYGNPDLTADYHIRSLAEVADLLGL